jgi:hypothetical protein
MFTQNTRYLRFEAILVWYPGNGSDVIPHLERAPVVILWQCPESLEQELRPWVFRARPFQTPLIDLARTEEELWQQMDQLCRRQIRKAQKLDCVISCNEDIETARALMNDSIRRLRYRAELGEADWRALLPRHDILLCKRQGSPLAVHVVLRDHPGRARLMMSGSVDRDDERFRNTVGPANRLLHWHELQHYKAAGFRAYDFGGIEFNQNLAEPIPQFKLSFGGVVVAEPMLYLAKNPVLRAALRGIGTARDAARKLPWPEAWLKALRARS